MTGKNSARMGKYLAFGVSAVLFFFGLNWRYTVILVNHAIAQGTYPTAEQGMIERATAYYEGMELSKGEKHDCGR